MNNIITDCRGVNTVLDAQVVEVTHVVCVGLKHKTRITGFYNTSSSARSLYRPPPPVRTHYYNRGLDELYYYYYSNRYTQPFSFFFFFFSVQRHCIHDVIIRIYSTRKHTHRTYILNIIYYVHDVSIHLSFESPVAMHCGGCAAFTIPPGTGECGMTLNRLPLSMLTLAPNTT